jgi:D-alanyl-D-alanine carboxypeptidase
MELRATQAPRRPRNWRLNGARYEWLPIDAVPRSRRALPCPIGEIRRKADDRRLAWFGLRDRARGGAWKVLALPRAHAGTRAARRELHDLLRQLGPRGNLRMAAQSPRRRGGPRLGGSVAPAARTRATRCGREPRLPVLALPVDYAARTGLPRQREPTLLVDAGRDAFGRRAWLQAAAALDWQRMRVAAARDRVTLQLVSAFRHAAYQTRLVQRKRARGLTLDEILKVNAAPGYSEHHSGRAIDLTTPGCAPAEVDFETTPAFDWLRRHAARFGFRLSYPRGNPHGVTYEPWHWYHVGA